MYWTFIKPLLGIILSFIIIGVIFYSLGKALNNGAFITCALAMLVIIIASICAFLYLTVVIFVAKNL